MRDWLKENWFLIIFLSGAFAVYVEWRVSETTNAEVGEIAFVSPSDFAVEKEKLAREIAANAERIQNNKENADKLDNKIERIVAILLEE